MKIYNKSNFILGLFFGLLGIAMLIVGIWKGFDIKGSIIMILCLFFGVGIIIRSCTDCFMTVFRPNRSSGWKPLRCFPQEENTVSL